MTAGHEPEDPIEGHRAWINYALQNNPDITIFIAIPQIDFPAAWEQRAQEFGFETIQELYDNFVNEIVHDAMVDQLRLEFPSTKIFTIPTGQTSLNLDQMNEANELLDDITRFGPQVSSLFTDTKGHQGDIIREAGSLLWLNNVYGVDLSTYDYDTGFNTDLHAIAEDISNNHDPDYKLCFEESNPTEDCLENTTDLSIEMSWAQEPNGWTYESFIKIPDGATAEDVYPVCIALHGNGGNGEFMRNNIGNLLDCHIVVAPSGYSNSWNICGEQSDAPDVAFVNLLIEELTQYCNVDPNNIKILGSSNGAALTNRMLIENDMPNVSQFVAIVSQMTDPQFHDGDFHSPSGETNNQSAFCGYDVVNSITNNRAYLSICNINDGVIPYEGGSSVGTSFIPAEQSIFEIAKSQGYTGGQISGGAQIDNSDVYTFSYLDDQVVLLNGMAGHTTNEIQRDYIKSFMKDCEEETEDTDLCTSDDRFSEIEYFSEAEIDSDLDMIYATDVMDWQGNAQDLAMDIFYPSSTIDPMEKRPFVLMIHGGAFQFGAKETLRGTCQEFAQRGYVAATMEYRLGFNTANPLDQINAVYRANQDAHAAMRFITENAPMYNIDTDAMFIGGGSAGAITALNVIYIDQQEWAIGFPTTVSQEGPLYSSGNDLTNTYTLKGVFNNWGSNRVASMQVDEMVPSIAFHGAMDNVVPIGEGAFGAYGSGALHDLYLANGVCSEITIDPQGGHGIYVDQAGTEFRVARASCFFKSIFCDNCSSSYMEEQVFADCSMNAAIDNDGDGFFAEDDCDDNNPAVNPAEAEIVYNGIDDDCDPATLDDDLDQDGFNLVDDCDDTNALINSAQAEIVYNGIDDDCDPSTLDDDLDQDGFNLVDDCDDTNALINSAQAEIVYNGIDDDCNPSTLDDDLDQDGFVLADDCDDTNSNINPDAEEIPNNGIDENCDGMDLMTSTYEISNTTIKIFPNPASTVINIEVEGTLDFEARLYDLHGRLLQRKLNPNRMLLNDLVGGTYLLEIKELNSAQKHIEKIVLIK